MRNHNCCVTYPPTDIFHPQFCSSTFAVLTIGKRSGVQSMLDGGLMSTGFETTLIELGKQHTREKPI